MHSGDVTCIDFAADGRCLSAGWDGTARLWSLDDSRASRVFDVSDHFVLFAGFCGGDESFLTSDFNGLLTRWSVATGEQEKQVTLDPRHGFAAISPDGKWLISSPNDPGAVEIRDTTTLEVVQKVPFAGRVNSFGWSADSRYAVVGGDEDAGIAVFDRESAEVVSEAQPPFGVQSLAVSSDGTKVAIGGFDNVAILAFPDLGDEPLDGVGGFETGVTGLMWNGPDSVVFGDEDGVIANLDVGDSEFTWLAEEHKESVPALAKSPDGKVVASGSRDASVRFWSLADGSEMFTAPGNRDMVQAVAWSRDGKRIFAGDYANVVATYLANGRGKPASSVAHANSVLALQALEDGSVRSFAYDRVLQTLDAKTASVQASTPLKAGDDVDALSFAFGPKFGWIGTSAGLIHRVDLATGELVGEPLDQGSPVVGIAVAPDGSRIASIGFDGGIELWGADGAEIAQLVDLDEETSYLAFAGPELVVAARADGLLRIWSAVDGTLRHTVETAAADPVQCVAASADGKRVLTGHVEKIRIWSTESGTLERSTAAYAALPYCAAFSPDGKSVATGMNSGVVMVWTVDRIGDGEQD